MRNPLHGLFHLISIMALHGKYYYNIFHRQGNGGPKRFSRLTPGHPANTWQMGDTNTGWVGEPGVSPVEGCGVPVPLSPTPHLPGAPQPSGWGALCSPPAESGRTEMEDDAAQGNEPLGSEREVIMGPGHLGKFSWRKGSEAKQNLDSDLHPSWAFPWRAGLCSSANGRGGPRSRGDPAVCMKSHRSHSLGWVGRRALGMQPTLKALIGVNEWVVVRLV